MDDGVAVGEFVGPGGTGDLYAISSPGAWLLQISVASAHASAPIGFYVRLDAIGPVAACSNHR